MAIRPSDRSILNRAAGCAVTLVLGIGIVHAADAPSGVVVNGQALPAATVRALEQAYRVPIAPGRYWYDAVSGAWGSEGGAIAGQMMPGLRLGGPLAADASRGNSQVFINGRELMMGEVRALQQACRTAVHRGRYWVNAQGVGGVEAGRRSSTWRFVASRRASPAGRAPAPIVTAAATAARTGCGAGSAPPDDIRGPRQRRSAGRPPRDVASRDRDSARRPRHLAACQTEGAVEAPSDF